MVALSKLPKAVFCLINLSAISILSLPVTTFGFAPPSVLQSQRLGSHLLSKRDSNDVNDEQTMDRRSFGTSALKTMGGIALSSLLLDSPISSKPAFAAEGEKKKRILVTGSNSGIGMDAAMRMAMQGHEVVLACVSFANFIVMFCFFYSFLFLIYLHSLYYFYIFPFFQFSNYLLRSHFLVV